MFIGGVLCSEYNLRSLRRGFGQIRDIHYESSESGKPSLVIHSSTLEKNENEIVIATNAVLQELVKTELRKRFAIVHTEKCVYIIGGTSRIFDFLSPVLRMFDRLCVRSENSSKEQTIAVSL